jgi:hypothetical protein
MTETIISKETTIAIKITLTITILKESTAFKNQDSLNLDKIITRNMNKNPTIAKEVALLKTKANPKAMTGVLRLLKEKKITQKHTNPSIKMITHTREMKKKRKDNKEDIVPLPLNLINTEKTMI